MSNASSKKSDRFAGFEAIPLRITVRVGETRCRLSQLEELAPGQVIPLDHEVGDPFELCSGGVVLGFVEPVVDPDGVALKLTSVPAGEDDDG